MKSISLITITVAGLILAGCGVQMPQQSIQKAVPISHLAAHVHEGMVQTTKYVQVVTAPKPKPKPKPTTAAQPPAHPSTNSSGYINYWNNEPPLQDQGKYVVLTFDDGPSPWTGQLIQTLDKEQVPALFFWNTYHISFADENHVVQLLQNSPNIQVGDHTVDHPNMDYLGYQAQYNEIVNDRLTIQQLLGKPVIYYRPPFGNFNATTEKVLNQQQMTAVMWDDDSLDWKYNSDEQSILREIKSELRPGAIILMHDHPYTVKFLPDIISMIRANGYGFTTVVSPDANPTQATTPQPANGSTTGQPPSNQASSETAPPDNNVTSDVPTNTTS